MATREYSPSVSVSANKVITDYHISVCAAGVNCKKKYYGSFLGFYNAWIFRAQDAMTNDVLLIYFCFLRKIIKSMTKG